MKFLISILFLASTFNNCNVKKHEENKECLNINYSLSDFVKIDNQTSVYSLNEEKMRNFKAIKGIKFDSIKLNEAFYQFNEPYYKVFEQKFENYKIVGYYIEGYSDIVNAVFFNLVIYNLTNEITDCLIIDSRYNFEIDYFKKVNVNNNCEIEVIHYQNNQLEKKYLFKISNKGAFEEIIN